MISNCQLPSRTVLQLTERRVQASCPLHVGDTGSAELMAYFVLSLIKL